MTRRRGLYLKYVVVLVTFVSGALLVSGAVELWFSYDENKAALLAVQNEKAVGAAARIEAFVKEIERQMGWTTQLQVVAPAAALEQRQIDFLRLQRQALPITELAYLDATGKEQVRVSRVAMNVIGSQIDFSDKPQFVEGRKRTWFGPVSFRKESEPYMTIAMPVSGGGVSVADVNLKFIWDAVSQIKVGKAGRAFVVDEQGTLVAHPDISLVLQKTSLMKLAHVKAAVTASTPDGAVERVPIAKDVHGRDVLTAYSVIVPLRWAVFVEQPLEEAFEPLRASVKRTIVLLALGIALSVVASVVLVRRMVRPIRTLEEGAARIGAGELGHRLDVRTGDELEAFADQFNRMTAHLQESHATLEQRVVERTRELSEALEQQTATAEILRVISSSPTDVQPVFEAIVRSAVRLCDANSGRVFRFDGRLISVLAEHDVEPTSLDEVRQTYPTEATEENLAGRAVIRGTVIHVADMETDPTVSDRSRRFARLAGYRSFLAVPMLREGQAIGVIALAHAEAPFTDKQIELLKTFADQAVIAVENVRLFTALQERTRELARSVEQLTALGDVSRAVSSTLDLDRVLTAVVSRASHLADADGCSIYEYDEASDGFRVRATQQIGEQLLETQRSVVLRRGEGAVGQLAVTREPVQIPDIVEERAYRSPLRDVLLRGGYRALLAVPMLREDRIVGGLVVSRRTPGQFPPETVELLKTFANQSALAIQNARLFREIEDKSRQLEVANRHKSEFLANMSHELRTPLNAVIGFSEVLLERMFGELTDKQEEYLRDIYSSGRHLLSLINDILDLAKIEAGRMELETTIFDLPQAIENALSLVRGRADAHAIRLDVAVHRRLGDFAGDERKVKQILLNLLSNAVKFTPEGGRVALRADVANGSVEISVTDNGIGIAPEDQQAIFEEFRQVGTDYARKREGTGLGLALTKRFVELHGGAIWVKSAVGDGSTFTFTLPVRPWPTSSS
jgi:signal transduction histidine kinase/HAMP domain-containing protein